jgi:hypothetical protein
MAPLPAAKRSTTLSSVSRPIVTRARHSNASAPETCRAVNGSHAPTLIRPRIVRHIGRPVAALSPSACAK